MRIEDLDTAAWQRVGDMLDRLDLLAIDESLEDLREEIEENGAVFTRDSLDSFRTASADWHNVKQKIDGNGWSVFLGAQAAKGRQPTDIGVVQADGFCMVLTL